MLNVKTIAVALTCVLGTAAPLWAEPALKLQGLWGVQGTLPQEDRYLNGALALTGTQLFAGGQLQTDAGPQPVIQVFDAATGQYQRTIAYPPATLSSGLGETLGASADYVVTSTFRSGAGALQVFDAATGTHLRTIDNPRADDSIMFGHTPIAVHGNRAVAGVTLTDNILATAWVFDLDTGDVILTLDEPDADRDRPDMTVFGFDKAMTDRHILISAWTKDVGDVGDAGAAYLYDAGTGVLLHTFLPTDPDPRTHFGLDVALSDTTAYVAGFRHAGPFRTLIQEISAFDLETGALKFVVQDPHVPQTGDEVQASVLGSGFGSAFAPVGDVLVIGVENISVAGAEQVGALHVYDAQTGQKLQEVTDPRGVEGDNFGARLVTDGARLGIGATPGTAFTLFDALRLQMFAVE